MVARSRFSRGPSPERTICPLYIKKVNQLSWLPVERATPPAYRLLLSLIVLLTSLAAAAQISGEMYTVSAQQLRVPTKARAHLKLAQREFSRSNLAGAEKEIDQALQVDSICAAAFSMRALLRLASRDFNGAIENATRAIALDPNESDAYVALATAYNSLTERKPRSQASLTPNNAGRRPMPSTGFAIRRTACFWMASETTKITTGWEL
jgi:tetratricopeptide (TPR) repeat protein